MSRRAPIFVGVGAALLVVLAIFVLVLPKSAEIAETTAAVTTAEQQEQSLLVHLQALQEARASALQTKREIQQVEAMVPSTADLPALIRLLRDASDRAGVDLFQFSPGTPTLDPSGTFSIIATSVNVTGSYFALDEFLYRMESLPRAAKVTSVQISPGGTEGTTSTTTTTPVTGSELTMQLTVEFYTSDLSAGPGSVPGSTETPGA